MKAIYDGTVIAESDSTELVEGNHYFPRGSVNMALLGASATPYTCHWKGSAEYFHLEAEGQQVRDIAWSYPDPKPAAHTIAGHVAFDQRKGVRLVR
jgi:uncharacterized protein (DUF427 family)